MLFSSSLICPLKSLLYREKCKIVRSDPGSTSMDDVKKYDSTSPLFAYIPKEVRKGLLHDFEDLLTDDFCTITKVRSL